MKARTATANSAGHAICRTLVAIRSCPELDAYLSGNNKWKSEKRGLELFRRRAPYTKLAVKRMKHALNFRLKQMAASISSRKRLRGDNEKQKTEDLMKQVAVRFFVWKDHLPDFLIRAARKRNDPDFLARLANAHRKGVNPLFDEIDITILACWDALDWLFSRSFFAFAYVDKSLPGLSKWRDAPAAAFIAFTEQNPNLYSQAAKPTKDFPNRRPYQTYKKRRQNLDLFPSKRTIITAAHWDQHGDVLHVASEAEEWGWEIYRFIPTPD
jgi:hypothetical protein